MIAVQMKSIAALGNDVQIQQVEQNDQITAPTKPSLWRRILRLFMIYIQTPPADLDMESWRRLEHPKEYREFSSARDSGFHRFM